MPESAYNLILLLADPLLGWLLHLPRDAALVLVAAATGLVLIAARLVFTDQVMLKRCKEDKAILLRLLKEARAAGDAPSARRYRASLGQIGMILLKAEGRPLLVSIAPIVVIAVWAFARIAYIPPQPGDAINLNVYFYRTAIGDLVYMLPVEGMDARDGLIRRIGESVVPANPAPSWVPGWVAEWLGYSETDFIDGGEARWTAKFSGGQKPLVLTWNFRGVPFFGEVTVDGLRYSPPLIFPDNASVISIQAEIPVYRPLGMVPGVSALGLQPWVVGYLALVIPMSIFFKRLFKVC